MNLCLVGGAIRSLSLFIEGSLGKVFMGVMNSIMLGLLRHSASAAERVCIIIMGDTALGTKQEAGIIILTSPFRGVTLVS